MYKIIGYAAIFFTPLAPSTFFGWRVYSVVDEMTSGLWWLAIGAAVASVIGLEAVGIFAGHTTLDAFRLGKYEAALFSAVVMIAYVAIGVYELWGTIGAIIFLIAPLAYLAVGLRESLIEVDRQAKNETAQKYNFRQAQLDAQLQLQIEKERLKQEASIKKAELKASTVPAQASTSQHQAADTQHECGQCGRSFGSVQGLNAHKRFCEVK